MNNYPQNYNDIHLKVEVENTTIEVETEDGISYMIPFTQSLQDSVIPENIFKTNFDTNEMLDTHSLFKNQVGYRYLIKDPKVIDYYISLCHNSNFAFQFSLMPIIFLQFFQTMISIFGKGETGDQLANLIGVFIA